MTMLQVPRRGFAVSTSKNNIKIEVLGDWLEANLLFFEEPLSKVDVVDFLEEQQICSSQDVAHAIADDGWTELRRRKRTASISDGRLMIDAQTIRSSESWEDDPIRAFFVALSLFYAYPDWGGNHRNAPTQGLLFERVVEAIAKNLFPGWETYRVGWSPEFTNSMHDVVHDLCDRLNCMGSDKLGEWIPDQAKDGGLDLVCFKRFDDDREAVPVYLLQCASGSNWRSKVNTPSPDSWQKYLDSAVRPGTGIAAPFVVPAKKLRVAALQGQAIVLDRLRLLNGLYSDESVVDNDLKAEISVWLTPFVDELPAIDDV